MKTGDHVHMHMSDYIKWLHAHHDVHNQNHTADMYSFAGVDPVHRAHTQDRRGSFVTLKIVDPRKYLSAKLRYGI